MIPVTTEQYFVEYENRPRRIAFLVDIGQVCDQLFNEIVTFNVSTWGGRYNPIIPIINGDIPNPYLRLLKLVDPDLLYAFCELPEPLAEKLSEELRPLSIQSRKAADEGGDFRVRIDYQASVVHVLTNLQNLPFRLAGRDPAIIVFRYEDIAQLTHFVLRVFGAIPELTIWARNHSIPSFALPADEKQVMKALAENRNLVLPIHCCGEGPRKLYADTRSQGIGLNLFLGTSPWNFIEYWNSAHFREARSDPFQSLSELWVPPELLQDNERYPLFLELLRRRTFLSEHSSRLRIISYDVPEGELREATQRICSDFKWNLYPSTPVCRAAGDLPAFEPRGVLNIFFPATFRPRYQQLSGPGAFLELGAPFDSPVTQVTRDERWISELVIENPQQERYYANKTTWWKLPRKLGISELFIDGAATRVGNNHRICAEIRGEQQGVVLKIPNLSSLFETLILPRSRQSIIGDLYITSSDKGKYARGVLGLFESLQKASYVFEHKFWSSVIEALSSPVASEPTKQRLRTRLEKTNWVSMKQEDLVNVIVDEFVETAGHIQRPKQFIDFGHLFELYLGYLQGLSNDEALSEIRYYGTSQTLERDPFRRRARSNLESMLSEMTARRLFLQGAELQCGNCLASLWYHVDDLRAVVTCRGCRRNIDLPAQLPWSYALNELVVHAVRDHGVAPVIRTAYRLFENSRESFAFLPGIEVREYKDDSTAQVCELDLVWIRDGEFGVAEVKRTPTKFSLGQRTAAIFSAALPDRFLLVSTCGTNEEMQSARAKVGSRLDPRISVETWDPAVFETSSHSGWDTFVHSVFP